MMDLSVRHVKGFVASSKESFDVFVEKMKNTEKDVKAFSLAVEDNFKRASVAASSFKLDASRTLEYIGKNWDRMSESTRKAWTEYITGGTRGLSALEAWADAIKTDVRYWILWITKYSRVAEKAQGMQIPFPEMPPAIEKVDREIRELGITYEDFVNMVKKSGGAFEEAWLEKAKTVFERLTAPAPAPAVAPPAVAPTVNAPVTIQIQGTSEEIARYVREKLVDELKDTVIRATSSAAPVAKKIILPRTFIY